METQAMVDVRIREAVAGDEQWVTDLMERTLTPYYDGDNRAHAHRIFHAHLDGGHDRVGFFSFEQRMFVAEVGGNRAGIIHLVGKRQRTYKISPLIVAEDYRGTNGLGSVLLAHAIEYALRFGARQLYCTVAQSNRSAMQFFLRKGFIAAGSSDSHYKAGSTEVMLYRQLHDEGALKRLDQASISIMPFDEKKDAAQVRALILKTLPDAFGGVDDAWVDALFAGYRRRHTGDVNAKYKLIYVAKSSDGRVVGVAGATPKKGTPIKLMPLIAESDQAFDSLVCDLPHLLAATGHKIYLHVCPTVQEVLAMQRHGWRLDAAMPGAYRADVVTQQWSLDVSKNAMRTMRVKRKFFDHIRSGRKDLEVRVAYDTVKEIQVGERIRFVTHDDVCIIRVVGKRTYGSFKEMLESESYVRVAPDSSSADDVLWTLKGFYGDSKEALGVVVLELGRG